MKKTQLLICGALLIAAIFIAGATVASAQVNTNNSYTALQLPSVSILPDSPIYGLKLAWETIVDAFTFGDNKINRDILLAQRRLAEAVAMENKNLPAEAEQALTRAQARYEDAIARTQLLDATTAAGIIAKIENTVGKHIETLNQVLTKANTNARQGLQNAITNSSKVLQKLQEVKTRVLQNQQENLNRGNDYTNTNESRDYTEIRDNRNENSNMNESRDYTEIDGNRGNVNDGESHRP